jgi:PDZ domain/Caspase domain
MSGNLLKLGGLALTLVLIGTTTTPAAVRELKTLHVLLVLDTNDEKVGDSAARDGENMSELLNSGIPRERLRLTILNGNRATADSVRAYYRQVNAGPEDGMLFYFSGHGATDMGQRRSEHFVALADRRLYRSEIRAIMWAKRPGRAVLITDCCSDRIGGEPPPPPLTGMAPEGPTEIHPALRSLFFTPGAPVDVTASTHDKSWGNAVDGGVFTRAFRDLFLDGATWKNTDLTALGGRDPKRLTWSEFFPVLQDAAEKLFAAVKREHPEVKQETQKPYRFRLLGVAIDENGGNGVRVLSVIPGSPADSGEVHLERGDVLLAVDGRRLANVQDFLTAIAEAEGTITLQVRDVNTGRVLTSKVPLD